VSVPASDKRLLDFSHLYVATTRHSVLEMHAQPHQIRVNNIYGSANVVEISGESDWTFHPTESGAVDIAVMPIDAGELDVKPVPRAMFLTDDVMHERYIGPGDEITITGLFTRTPGKTKNVPIVRRGTLAMIPEETVRATMGDGTYAPIDAYLIEVRSTGGISGSPAFVRAPVGFDVLVHDRSGERRVAKAHAQADYYFLGVIHGHWDTTVRELNSYDGAIGNTKEEESINTGIAIVIPAKRVLEVLDDPKLVAMRVEAESAAIEALRSKVRD
jgi:hypothetical protein